MAEQTLADKAKAKLEKFFADKGTSPGVKLWAGISGLLEASERVVNKSVPPVPLLSMLDPGVGKTESEVHFLLELLASPEHKDVAVLYCVSRLNEVKTLVDRLGNEVGVFTGDKETNKLGKKEPFEARILLTTQQLVDSRLSKVKTFSSLSEFHYMGQSRLYKIWDESLLPAEALTLNLHPFEALPHTLVKHGFRDAEKLRAIDAVIKTVLNLESETAYTVPDLGLVYDDMMDLVSDLDDSILRQAVRVLCLIQGKETRVRRDDFTGNTILDYQNTLPEDFYPVIILDASGNVRETYQLWEEYRGGLFVIRGGRKTYEKLKVHRWNKGGGKASWKRNGPLLLEGIVNTINSKPDEKWLVIVHKESHEIPDLQSEITLRASNPENVRFLQWANAHATNDFVDCTNVILAGTLFYPEYYYEATARASMGLPHDQKLDTDIYKDLEIGEHMHLILQAACRGSCRRCEGDSAAAMDLYLLMSKGTGLSDDLLRKKVFPGCEVIPWEPIGAGEFKGRRKDVRDFILSNRNPNHPIFTKDICSALGMQVKHLNRLFKKDDLFVRFLEGESIWFTSENALPHEQKDRLIWKPEQLAEAA